MLNFHSSYVPVSLTTYHVPTPCSLTRGVFWGGATPGHTHTPRVCNGIYQFVTVPMRGLLNDVNSYIDILLTPGYSTKTTSSFSFSKASLESIFKKNSNIASLGAGTAGMCMKYGEIFNTGNLQEPPRAETEWRRNFCQNGFDVRQP